VYIINFRPPLGGAVKKSKGPRRGEGKGKGRRREGEGEGKGGGKESKILNYLHPCMVRFEVKK